MSGSSSAIDVRKRTAPRWNLSRATIINLFIAGFSLFMGLSVPAYFSSVADPAGMQPNQTLALYKPTASSLLEQLDVGVRSVILSVGSTGMAVAAILGLVLDNVIPGSRTERGLIAEGDEILVPEAGNIDQQPFEDD